MPSLTRLHFVLPFGVRSALAAGALGLSAALAPGAAAQTASPFPQDARADVPFASTLGMGDAATAVPSMDAAFFTNPALLGSLDLARPNVQIVGAGGDVGGNFFDLLTFYRDELGPAIEEGLDDICTNDRDRCTALYERALLLGNRPTTAGAAAFGPAVQIGVGPGAAVQAGAFAHSNARVRFFDGGAGVPVVDLYDQTDLVVPVGAAVRVPGTPLSIGASASYTRRWVTGKYAFIDELNPDAEAFYVLTGSAVSFDVGMHARDVGMRGLDIGAAVHRLAGGAFAYRYTTRIEIEGQGFADDEAEIAALEERFGAREAGPQLRVGAAYRLPAALFAGGGPLRHVVLAADYVGASTSEYDQTMAARLRIGAEVEAGPLALRAGLAQGYPAFGVGLNARFVRIDYAFFGVEEGRTAGQLRRGSHLLQVRFGLF